MRIAHLVRLRRLLGTLLIAAAALFAVGIATEGDSRHETVATVESVAHNEATEQADHNEQSGTSETGERILGINLESTPLVVIAVLISIALAAATWTHDDKVILLLTALFAAAFAVLDVAEFTHQLRQSAATIAIIAATIAVLHAAAAFLAEQRRTAMP
jgi:heme/copper-type cytochrome/quinol oxidase subunit 3